MRMRNPKRRAIVQTNLRLCFPELSETERAAIMVEHYRTFGATLLDMGTLWWGSPKKLARVIVHHDGAGYQAMARTKKVILFTPHVVGIDAGGIAISTKGSIVSMMKQDKNDLITLKLYQCRTRFNAPCLLLREQGLRRLITGIRAGRVGYYMPDEDFGATKYTEFVPFFGVQKSTLSMLGRICRLSGAIAVPCTTRLDLETGVYHFIVSDPVEHFPSGSAREDAARMNQMLESMIRRSPAQFMWTFKWFKTRPGDSRSPYLETTPQQ